MIDKKIMDDFKSVFASPLDVFKGFYHTDEKPYLKLAKKILIFSFVEDMMSKVILDESCNVYKTVLSFNNRDNVFELDFDRYAQDSDEVSFVVGSSDIIKYNEYLKLVEKEQIKINLDIKGDIPSKSIYVFKSFWKNMLGEYTDDGLYPFVMPTHHVEDVKEMLNFLNENVEFFKKLYKIDFTFDIDMNSKIITQCERSDIRSECDFTYADNRYNNYKDNANNQSIYKNIEAYKEKALLRYYQLIDNNNLPSAKPPKL